MLFSFCIKGRKLLAVLLLAAALAVSTLALRPSAAAASAGQGVEIPIIMYHSFCADKSLACDYVVSADTFRKDMEFLKANGYTTVFVSELIRWTQGEAALPDKPVVITLDDGFLNNATEVLPILEKLDMKAVVSVVGAYSDAYSANGDRNSAYAYLTWTDISELSASGHVEIGNHTYNMHGLGDRRGCMKKQGEKDSEYSTALKNDLKCLQDKLAQTQGAAPEVFAYPYGFQSEASLNVIKHMGFKAALTCEERVNHLTGDPEELYHLGRFNRPAKYSTTQFMSRLPG